VPDKSDDAGKHRVEGRAESKAMASDNGGVTRVDDPTPIDDDAREAEEWVAPTRPPRLPAPVRELWAKTAPGRAAVAAWSRRPPGRLSIAGMVIAAMLVFAGAAGAYVVPPATTPQAGAVPESASPSSGAASSAGPVRGRTVTPPARTFTFVPNPTATGVAERPADVYAAWAVPMGRKLDIPSVALQAYAYAERVMQDRKPSCQLKWTLLAGIAKIESNHGRAKGASLLPDGRALPAIVGPPLDGQSGRATITDTDEGRLDGDRSWDRAVGPMQFIPSTWRQYALDADRNQVSDPNDIDDATLAAAEYLCGARDLSTVVGWWAAVQSYNSPASYQRDVFNAADDYGRRSRT
jgi:membrane-bound lytic murein transglycosylase B